MHTTEEHTLEEQLIRFRRDLHMYPETGFLEMRTASIVAHELTKLGYSLQLGIDVMDPDACMGKPSDEETEAHYAWAIENGAHPDFVEHFKDGYTGIVATLDTGKEGPTLAYRFDMDALDIHECEEDAHVPVQKGFRSTLDHKMHACGHDAHTSIGLTVAKVLMDKKDALSGTIKLIFQPAEEGTRGAKSMTEKGVVDDVDMFIASHIGTGVPFGHFVAANNGFLATTKLNVTYKGTAAHAGSSPEEGKNALLAAANAAINLYAIPRHSDGATRMNVGEFHAGAGRNIIADTATMTIETRGETSEINAFVRSQAEAVIQGAATMYNVDYEIETVGDALSSQCSRELAENMYQIASDTGEMEHCEKEDNASAGSEDATYFMERVKECGGQATYVIFGTALAAGHHNEKFDIDERSLLPAVNVLVESAITLSNQ